MKRFNQDKINFNFILEYGIITALITIIIGVLIFPRMNFSNEEQKQFTETLVRIDDIPITVQDSRNEVKKKRKIIPPYVIFVPADYEVVLEEIDLSDEELAYNDNLIGQSESSGDGKEALAYSSLPYQPRQITEGIPAQMDDIRGSIKFSLLIDKSGNVKKHNVIFNRLKIRSFLIT